jgi:serine/threonine protein kinase
VAGTIVTEEKELAAKINEHVIAQSIHFREAKRIRDEDNSKFNHFPVLHNRYLLTKLLGKGGFSEVYKVGLPSPLPSPFFPLPSPLPSLSPSSSLPLPSPSSLTKLLPDPTSPPPSFHLPPLTFFWAYDLIELNEVACKIHRLGAHWSKTRQTNFARHACREYVIHKSLIHTGIVRLFDVFDIDQYTFCTILEYCTGGDLEEYLRQKQMLPQRETRFIIKQIVEVSPSSFFF